MLFQTAYTHRLIAGVDEVGRGPLAGAVVAAAVILDPAKPVDGLTDSKKLTAKRRAELDIQIRENALAWSITRAEVEEIDSLNIYHATLLAMKRAVEALSIVPDHVKVDGNACPSLQCSVEAIVKGDLTEPEISAASIIAKVSRDHEMEELDLIYPQYGFASHKGYPTKQHREAIQRYGILPVHRRSYAPIKKLIG